jgi:hypothetical protein
MGDGGVNLTDYERVAGPYTPLPQNRAQRRAASQNRARAERARRRSRARIEQALGQYQKVSTS